MHMHQRRYGMTTAERVGRPLVLSWFHKSARPLPQPSPLDVCFRWTVIPRNNFDTGKALPKTTVSRLSRNILIPVPMASSVASSGSASSFNDTHWDVLFKLLDAVVPPVVVVAADSLDSHSSAITISEAEFAKLYSDLQSDVKAPPSVEAFREYLAARASQNGDFVKTVKDMIDGLSPSVCGQLRFILGAMGLAKLLPLNEKQRNVEKADLRVI